MLQATTTKAVGESGMSRAALVLEPFVDVSLKAGAKSATSDKAPSPWTGLSRIAAFLLLIVAAMAATDYLIDSGLRRIKTSSFGVFNRIVNGDINAAILVSGSSRALNHFDPRVIQERTGKVTYNIGINGSQTDMQVAVFKTYLKHNVKPALLVQSLDSFTFVTSRDGIWFPAQYLPYLKEDAIYQALGTVDSHAWKAKHLPLYGYAVNDMNFTWVTGLAGRLGWNPREDRYLGFEPRKAQWSDDFARFKEGSHGTVRFKIEPEGVREFEELMALCKQMNIPVLLVYSPVYYEMQKIEVNRDEIFDRFKEIARRYDATLWDYSGSPLSLRRDYFVNSQHLNADGAAAFSADFGTALARSGLLEAK